MGRRRAIQEPETEGDVQLARLATYTEAERERADKQLDSLLDELGASTRVKISRVSPDTGMRQHVGELSGDVFSLDSLLRLYGGGRYVLRIHDGKQSRGTHLVELDPSVPPRNPLAPKQTESGGNDNVLLAGVAQMMQMQASSSQMMQTAMMTMMGGVAEMFKMSRGTDPLDQVAKIAEILKPATTAGDPISVLRQGMELAQQMGEGRGDGGGSGMLPIYAKGLEIIDRVATADANRRAVAPGGDVKQLQQPLRQERPAVRAWVGAARRYSALLVDAARRNMDPQIVAALAIDGADETQFADLLQDVQQEGFEGRVGMYFPELDGVADWRAAFTAGLVLTAREASEGQEPEEPAPQMPSFPAQSGG